MTDNKTWILHDNACRTGDATYRDPVSGYRVFTAEALRARGRCCGSGCRHCPFAHEAVSDSHSETATAGWLTDARPNSGSTATALFWSGGKDSYLTYRRLAHETTHNITLLTTFDARSRWIAHQDLQLDSIIEQARSLDLPLIGAPLSPHRPYIEHVRGALKLLAGCTALAFGDLHLRHIRQWREQVFRACPQTAHMKLLFPLWGQSYATLLDTLEVSGIECRVSAVVHPSLAHVKIGERFSRKFLQELPEGVDGFGERGEFHTQVLLPRDA